MILPPHNNSDHREFRQGIDLFNRVQFFDAHEALEDIWRSVPRDLALRRHLQGMVQLAVAFHHHSTGNHLGAFSVLVRAIRNLDGAENSFPHIDLARLRTDLEPWRTYLESSNALVASNDAPSKAPALPRILLRDQADPTRVLHTAPARILF